MVRPRSEDRETDDAGVWSRLRAGDERALEELFGLYYARLCTYVLRIVRERDLAESVVTDVMMTLWDRREVLKITTSPRGYLYGAVRLRALDVTRTQRTEWAWEDRAGREPEALGIGHNPAPDTAITEAEIDEAISNGIALLPPRCRTVFELRWYGQMSYAEIAAALDISVKTVEIQVSKAFRTLRVLLEPFL